MICVCECVAWKEQYCRLQFSNVAVYTTFVYDLRYEGMGEFTNVSGSRGILLLSDKRARGFIILTIKII
jgi:hypothetical protein